MTQTLETSLAHLPRTRRQILMLGIAMTSAGVLASCVPANTSGTSGGGQSAAAAGSSGPSAGGSGTTSQSGGAAGSTSSSSAAARPAVVNLTVVTGEMIGNKDHPAYIPSDFSLPANSVVEVVVTNFDDATPLPQGFQQYAKVSGTVGSTASVQPLQKGSPNATGQSTSITELDPKDVSHTMTVPGLQLNVPISPMARTSFTVKTGAPGVFDWQCMDPCGAGDSGWEGGMSETGFMRGKVTVA